jgi:hypothetical protein
MSFQWLMLANVAIGAVFGVLLDPLYTIVTVGVVLALTWAATRSLTQPLLRPTASPLQLPQRIEARAVSTLAQLAPGPARDLLVDVVRSAQHGHARTHRSGAVSPLAIRLEELVVAACDAALELSGIDAALERLHKARVRHSRLPKDWHSGLARSESARDSLVQRLLEAVAALASLEIAGAEGSEARATEEALCELTRELADEQKMQAEAARELEAFLEG